MLMNHETILPKIKTRYKIHLTFYSVFATKYDAQNAMPTNENISAAQKKNQSAYYHTVAAMYAFYTNFPNGCHSFCVMIIFSPGGTVFLV